MYLCSQHSPEFTGTSLSLITKYFSAYVLLNSHTETQGSSLILVVMFWGARSTLFDLQTQETWRKLYGLNTPAVTFCNSLQCKLLSMLLPFLQKRMPEQIVPFIDTPPCDVTQGVISIDPPTGAAEACALE